MGFGPWKEIDVDDIGSGAHQFRKELSKLNLRQDLEEEIISQINEITSETHNIIFVFSDKEWIVTGIHVPDEALDGQESPILMRGANPRHIIAAFSQSEIRKKIRAFDELEIITGLPQESDEGWTHELEHMCEDVMVKLRTNPPESWDDLLK